MTPVEKEREQVAAAQRGVDLVKDGMTIGLGSGSTASHAIRLLGDRVRDGLRVQAVPTSRRSAELARSVGIPLIDFTSVQVLDLTIDGADEVDPALRLIKGGGGALLRERIVASASREVVIIVDETKRVPVLGRFPLPIEVIPFALPLVKRHVAALGAQVTVRGQAEGAAFVTDEGHNILDCHFDAIPDPVALARRLGGIAGLVTHGLFLDLADIVLVALGRDVIELRPPSSGMGKVFQR